MSVAVIAWARNEADVLEAWVRHHVKHADSVHIVLHRTRDNSADILTQMKAEGIAITWSPDERLMHEQSAVLTRLLHERVKAGYDWILPLDLDEFVTGDVGAQLQEHKGRILRIGWKGYVPTASDPAEEKHVLRRITYCRAHEDPLWYKVCIPASAVQNDGFSIDLGNHALLDATGKACKAHDCDLSLAHIPIRSANQLRRKICCGLVADRVNQTENSGTSFHWKEMHARLQNEMLPTPHDLRMMAYDYASAKQWERFQNGSVIVEETNISLVHDPVPSPEDIRYDIVEADTDKVIRENDALCSEVANAKVA